MGECRIVIGGCRDYENYEVFEKCVTNIIARLESVEYITVLSGHCSGVDKMAEAFAKSNNYAVSAEKQLYINYI